MNYITKKKFDELTKELQDLITKGREELSQRLDEAKALGDLKENAEYHQAREDQAKMESRIIELEDLLHDVQIIKKAKSKIIQIGTEVEIAKKNASKTSAYQIVGSEDADVLEGRIDFNAPLAKAMLGKKEGDVFDFKLPSGENVSYRIVKIK